MVNTIAVTSELIVLSVNVPFIILIFRNFRFDIECSVPIFIQHLVVKPCKQMLHHFSCLHTASNENLASTELESKIRFYVLT